MRRTAEFWSVRAVGLGAVVGGLALGACGSSSDGGAGGGGPAAGNPGAGATLSFGGSAGQGVVLGTGGAVAGSGTINPGQAGRGSSTGGNGFAECAGEVSNGKLAPLDMYILLDSSGSMLDETAARIQKWEAVKTALVAFLSDPGSAGLSVGIQYFPLRREGVPARCTTDAQCGVGGPCFLNACARTNNDLLVPCLSRSDCVTTVGDFGQCVELGECEDGPFVCPLGERCLFLDEMDQLIDLGECRFVPSVCLDATECSVASYAAPAVPIAELPQAAPALIASIEAREPDGATPTGPAIRGAIEQSRAWATAHPGHAVVAVLATDGLPTDCTPLEIPSIADLASFGVQGTPSIRTFVVGVFGPNDADARTNLDAIARAGGSDSAFLVDTSQDVTQQFLSALNAIRGARLGCEFQIPEPTGPDPLDYNLVNVQLTNAGTTQPLYYVGASADACDANGGWHYDTDYKQAAPTRIVMCPSTCETIKGAADASVEIQLGCMTRPR